MADSELKKGKVVIEGKTKIVYELQDSLGEVLLQSKDRITAGDGARGHDLEGKAAISTTTTCAIFEMLNSAGIKTHFLRKASDTTFVAKHCQMIPIEWVTRRVATGSFLKRHPGVQEGLRFSPPKLETFFKDDANHDPQWSREQLLMAKLKVGGKVIGADDYQILAQTTVTVFEILEKAWGSQDCSLIDMKIEFGVITETGELVVGDVIDSDSWRLWPAGDRRLMKDKQVYRDLQDVTAEGLQAVKRNFQWVAERVSLLWPKPKGRVVVIMGSIGDKAHGESVKKTCQGVGVPCELRVVSAHKSTEVALSILHEYEGEGIPTVFVAVAGRSNGLGPVLSGNTSWPVINCPPVSPDWGAQDIWSSLRMPSGMGCSTVITVMYPEAAALNAAQILSLTDHVVWSKIRTRRLNTMITLITKDQEVRDDK
ncbi:hypothetical protein ACOMHN_034995 [Nucella lapillus]